MFSRFLTTTLTTARSENGCGMSTRPGFYSGRGATTTDLSSAVLETIFQAIVKNVSAEAGEEFVQMVEDIPVLSATDFLITLSAFEGNHYVWTTALLGTQKGAYPDCEGSAVATVLIALGGRRGDETASIRRTFLHDHGRRTMEIDMYGFNDYARRSVRR